MRERALHLASLGFKVFRLKPNSKLPAVENFHAVATSDPAKVRRMWTEAVTGESATHNIGILTGAKDAQLLVIDVDGAGHAEGKRGFESLDGLKKSRGLDTNTLTAVTPSGGRHLFYSVPPHREISGHANRLGNGLDVRGYHQYVAGVGSVTAKGEYDWYEAETPILDAPEWLIDMCQRVERKVGAMAPRIELDTQPNVSRAVDWLKREAPNALEGAGGNDTTFKIACRVKDYGLSAEATFDAMLEHWNPSKALPEWDPDDLRRIVDNAYRYGQAPAGAIAAEAEFDEVTLVAGAKNTKERFRSYNFREARNAAIVNAYLVKGLLSRSSFAVLYGPPESGKTFISLDICHSIARGRSFQGRRVRQGLVVYVACEGQLLFSRRLQALHSTTPMSDRESAPLEMIYDNINLFEPADVDALINKVENLAAEHAQPVAMIVFDTLGRVTAGADENAHQDMSRAIAAADKIRQRTGATVMFVHHSGKDTSKGARGHTSLLGAIDTEIRVEKNKLSITKQRDGAGGGPYGFRLRPVMLGTDEDGDPVSSCVVDWTTASEFEHLELSRAAAGMWEAFQVAAKAETPAGGDWRSTQIATDAWEKSYREIKIDDAEVAGCECPRIPGPRQLRRLRTTVEKSGHVREVEKGQWVAA